MAMGEFLSYKIWRYPGFNVNVFTLYRSKKLMACKNWVGSFEIRCTLYIVYLMILYLSECLYEIPYIDEAGKT
jgi:hypothetical protein